MTSATDILRREMMAGQNVLLVGPPGVAKTSVILATARVCGFKTSIETENGPMSTIFRCSLMERVDWTGCLVPDNKKGVTKQLPFSVIKSLQKTTEKTLIFLDDMGQGPMDVQASLMRSFDDNYFPPNVSIWAATNRPGDKAGVSALCEPLRSRFHAAYIIPTPDIEDKADGGTLLCSWTDWVENWVIWAMDEANAPAEIIAWHRSTNGKSLYNWKPNADPSVRLADFRGWGAMIKRWNLGMRSLQECSAVLGKAVSAEFLGFTELSDKIPSPDEVWMNPLQALVPENTSAKFLIATVLAQQVKATCCNEFIQYIERLGRVMCAYAVKDAYRRLQQTISGNKEWVRFYRANKSLFGLD